MILHAECFENMCIIHYITREGKTLMHVVFYED